MCHPYLIPLTRKIMSRSKKLQKALQGYLNKIKKPSPNLQFPASQSLSSSKSWILSGCRHPKTLSFAVDDSRHSRPTSTENNCAATLSDIDRFLFENFKSLYIKEEETSQADDDSRPQQSPRGILFESPRFVDPPPDLCGSNRFFVAPAVSGSLIEEARNSGNTTVWDEPEGGGSSSGSSTTNYSSTVLEPKDVEMPKECVALLTYSPNPYEDFRRSMEEMVVERMERGGGAQVDWDFMEELLFCYLNLNDKKSYKFILSAFVDLVVDLRRKDQRSPPARSRSSRQRRTRHVYV